MIRERERNGVHGLLMVLVVIGVLAAGIWLFVEFVQSVEARAPRPALMIGVFTLLVAEILLVRGFFMVAPNEARVTITEIGGGRARMSIQNTFRDVAAMEQLLAMGMEDGMTEAMGQIDAILAERPVVQPAGRA